MINAQMLRLVASDTEQAERALKLALADCAALKQKVATLEAEREAYFKPRIDGQVSVNVLHDTHHGALRFRASVGNAQITSVVDESVFWEDQWGDVLVYVGREVAAGIARLVGERIAPLLVRAMKDTTP